MAALVWNASLSVNIKEIDQQHKRLVEMVNELEEAMRGGKGKEVLGGILDRLIRYTQEHFAVEESYMKKYGYPAYEEHKEKHTKMAKKVLALKSDYEAKKVTLSFEVSKFLQDWLTKHIMGTDKKYSAFLNSKGVV